MILTLLRNCQILSNFLTICGKSDIEIVDKEIAKNLLESLIILYLRARTFKYVSLKKEAFKLESKKKKLKSLQTSIKKHQKILKLDTDMVIDKNSYFYSYKSLKKHILVVIYL